MTLSVVALGEVMLELTHRTDTELTLAVAGDTFNTAAHLASALGTDGAVTYFTALGEGWYADLIQQRVHAAEVRTVITPTTGIPGAYFIRTDIDGERSFTHYRSASAARGMLGGDGPRLLQAACVGADLIHLSAITLQILDQPDRDLLGAILDQARTDGARVSLDTNYRATGWPSARAAAAVIDAFASRADVVLPSVDDERALRGLDGPLEVARHYRDLGADEVVVKAGTAPSMVVWPGGTEQLAVEPVPRAVDTSGAGDAFDAGYLAGRLLGCDPIAAVRRAQALAAQTVTHPGALPPPPASIPSANLPRGKALP